MCRSLNEEKECFTLFYVLSDHKISRTNLFLVLKSLVFLVWLVCWPFKVYLNIPYVAGLIVIVNLKFDDKFCWCFRYVFSEWTVSSE